MDNTVSGAVRSRVMQKIRSQYVNQNWQYGHTCMGPGFGIIYTPGEPPGIPDVLPPKYQPDLFV